MSWIKFDTATPDKPEVWQIASDLGIDPDAVVGKLLRVWAWFDEQSADGSAPESVMALLDRIAGVQGFCAAMASSGWLIVSDGAVYVPSFDKHNSSSAKTRADTAARVAKHKQKKREHGNGEVTRKVLPRPIVAAVKKRDSNTCVYCGRVEGSYVPPELPSDSAMHIDHVIPVTRGGSDEMNNLVCACSVCNMFKSNRTPAECGLPWPTDAAGNRFGNAALLPNALPREEKIREEEDQEHSPSDLSSADADDSLDNTGESVGTVTKINQIPYQAITEAYNESCGDTLPQVSKLTDKRRKAIRARWMADTGNQAEHRRTNSLDYWQRYFAACMRVDFFRKAASGELRGEHAGWRPDFDFLMRETTWLGVREGRYS